MLRSEEKPKEKGKTIFEINLSENPPSSVYIEIENIKKKLKKIHMDFQGAPKVIDKTLGKASESKRVEDAKNLEYSCYP